MRRIRTAVVGASGYTGQELLRILLLHPGVEIVYATSRQYEGKEIGEVFRRFRGVPGAELRFSGAGVEGIVQSGAEAAFLALPHGVSMEYGKTLVEAGVRVVDLSADFRLKDPQVYKEYYGKEHCAPELLREAVYGMPERYREEISRARIVGAPGCYPTSILLPLLPLLRGGLLKTDGIVVNSGSGVTGAGRKADVMYHFCECNESMRAYGVPKHRHLSEIEQELSIAAERAVKITFIPHLMPVNTGILTTTVAQLCEGVGISEISDCYTKVYKDEPFVRLLGAGVPADTKNVTHSNYIDIGWTVDERTGRAILMSAEDNIVKGAGGQGVQALNIMFGLPETTGLMFL